ncbi:hypothetical protein GLYMA_17G180850v4 [Glycine max]|nr:hypothetical protein GLYMA_17G180850v4 [Glycine max]KAH1118989.1 hypothetical protein GYH30_047676 [Glycine max]
MFSKSYFLFILTLVLTMVEVYAKSLYYIEITSNTQNNRYIG